MKHKGCILEFTEERNKELLRAFRMAIDKAKIIDFAEISKEVVNTPCKRFWVSEERAMTVVAAMMRGKPILCAMLPTKREMFKEIYKRVIALKKKRPKATLSQLVANVVYSPAPKFYMRPRCAMEIIYKIKRGFYDKQQRD